jgi:predicted nucleic acid-binding protein
MTGKLVVDSSVIVKWISHQNEDDTDLAHKILVDLEKGKISLHLPELVKYEVANALLHKKLTLPQTKASLEPLYHLPIDWIPETLESAHSTLVYAQEKNITYYDATFLTLAATLRAKLITANPKHQHDPDISVIQLNQYR